ncbi:MAG: hypothetical protein DDT26_00793 [Dehalococcoidia bacterium]|nr:hypothetical protein [Chloroflexota bacterium]
MTQQQKSPLFEFVDSVNFTKKDMIRDSENPEAAEKGYSKFMVNRSASMHVDTILYANEVNQYPSLDSKLAYDYLRLSVRKQKRFGWIKKSQSATLDLIQSAMKVNVHRALEISKILSAEQLEVLKRAIYEGGKKGS